MSVTRLPVRVGLVEACEDEHLFNFPLWPRQREVLATIEDTRMSILCLGRRSGKTTLAALVLLWCCALRPQLLERLRPGERAFAVGISTNHRQARLLVAAALSIVERSPLLAPLVEHVTEDEIHFSTGATLAAFPCGSRGARGWPIFALCCDELAFFVDNEGNVSADAVWRALLPATAQFGDDARVLACSTPWGTDGLFAELWQKADSGELEGAVAHRATTREMNPTITDEFLATEQRRDPDGFRAEYEAEFLGSGLSFFDADNVAAAVTLSDELRPDDAVDWVAGLDPAFSSDPFGLCLVGRDPRDSRRLVVGKVHAWIAPTRKATSFEEGREIEDTVLAEVASVIRLFGARAVSDQYRSSGVAERLRRWGIRCRVIPMTAPTRDSAYGFLRGRVNEGSIELPDHPDLLRELRAIRTRYAAGKSSVVLPRIAGSHCDRAQALAIAVLEHDRRWDLGGVTISGPRGGVPVGARRFLVEEENDGYHGVVGTVRGYGHERLARHRGASPSTRLRPEIRT